MRDIATLPQVERGLSNDPLTHGGDCSWCFLGTVHLVLQAK